jgi:O-antigen ligase/Flp pilus assembly protein TadD
MAKQITSKKVRKENFEIKWIFSTALLITLFINPKLTDPFNAPKMYLLMLSSVVIASFLIFQTTNKTHLIPKSPLAPILIIFILILAIQVALTDLKYAAIFGDNLRQLGFLTYFGFAIFMLASMKFFRFESRLLLYNSIFVLSAFYIVYGIMQYTGNDPFNWVNQYNPIIGTLGNPNYSSALMAILATLCFSFFFDQDLTRAKRTLFISAFFLLAIVIVLTDASQGLLSMVAGVGLFSAVKLFKLRPGFGIASFVILVTGASFALAGILQSGPLERFLYKPSVTLRGYYWRSGLEMLHNNLITGVGIERFGVNFRQSVDPEFPIKFGYELMTNNAHNVPIQLFATGGIFLGLAYLAVLFTVLFYGLLGVRKLSGSRLNLLIGIFSAWIAYQLQSVVSIDNIGLTIWGWVLGGTIVGLVTSSMHGESAIDSNKSSHLVRKKSGASFQPLVTGVLLISCLILVLRLTQSESVMFKNRTQFNQASTQGQGTLPADLSSVIDDPLAQPYYKIEAADMFFMLGDNQAAITAAEKVVEYDPINSTYLGVLATMYEAVGRFDEAINQRVTLSRYDPNNARNYLQLIKLYKQVGDLTNATRMLDKIVLLTPDSEVADLARRELQ